MACDSGAGCAAIAEERVVNQGPLPPMIFRLDLAKVRAAVGDTDEAAALLADVRRRLAAYADPGHFADWVAAAEATLGVRGANRAGTVPAAAPAVPRSSQPLTAREQQVLQMLRSEFTVPEIAAHLFVSYNTAKSHTRTIYRKLGFSPARPLWPGVVSLAIRDLTDLRGCSGFVWSGPVADHAAHTNTGRRRRSGEPIPVVGHRHARGQPSTDPGDEVRARPTATGTRPVALAGTAAAVPASVGRAGLPATAPGRGCWGGSAGNR